MATELLRLLVSNDNHDPEATKLFVDSINQSDEDYLKSHSASKLRYAFRRPVTS